MGRPAGRKIYAHAKLRRLRREQGMNQVELARALSLSTSCLNRIEHSRRPLTAPVLLRIAEVFGVDPEFFSEAGEERLATDLRAALLDEACGTPVPVPQEEIADVARDHPEVARALVALHHRYRDVSERVVALASPEDTAGLLPAEPHDEVRDFFYAHHNHFAALEAHAERTAEALGLGRVGRAAEARRASPCTTRAPPPPSGWAVGSVNGRTAPSGPVRRRDPRRGPRPAHPRSVPGDHGPLTRTPDA